MRLADHCIPQKIEIQIEINDINKRLYVCLKLSHNLYVTPIGYSDDGVLYTVLVCIWCLSILLRIKHAQAISCVEFGRSFQQIKCAAHCQRRDIRKFSIVPKDTRDLTLFRFAHSVSRHRSSFILVNSEFLQSSCQGKKGFPSWLFQGVTQCQILLQRCPCGEIDGNVHAL